MIGTTISHYRILDRLGEGGMGVVYKAQDLKLDRPVAIKFLPQQSAASDESKARFIQEAKATAALNNPNILSVYDIDEQDGKLFFVMEYIEGRTLKSKITNLEGGKGVPVRQALDWTIQIAQGLKAAHDRNIVHRDIKPENIMLTNDGIPKIMDFGIAKLKGGTGLTKTGTSLGTLAYMSPEQVQGSEADHRSDIWSVGVVLYEMLTGQRPFRAEHEAALIYVVAHEEPAAPSVYDSSIPHRVDMLVMSLLEKDQGRRPQSADELLKTLQNVRDEVDSSTRSGKAKAIAVLPFENISPEKESEYFGDGLTEELIVHLSQVKEMEVVSRTTSMQYKGTKKDIKTIGRELGARYILEGSVRKFHDNLRIAVQLVDVETDRHLWAETYKGKLEDVFDIQEQVAKQIVDALMVKLTPTEKVVLTKRSTENAEAFDCALRARNFLYRRTKSSIQLAIQLFQKAIALDGRYAAAYAGLGEAHATLYRDFDRREELLEKALEASLKALMYDASLSEAYATLGLAYFGKKAFEEAMTAIQKAIALDPNNSNAYWILARIYHTSDRDKEAVKALEKAVELNPDFYEAYDDLRMYYEGLGDKEKHAAVIHKLLEIYPRYLSQHPDDAYRRMAFAVALALVGRAEEAKQEGMQALELSAGDPIMMYYGACLYARLQEKQLAIEWLRSTIAAGYENYEWIKRDPDFESIRGEPGYIDLMKGK
jgi:serine/threonine protein kinase/tetratricopeptide (TPR) repeat protein